MSKAQQLQHLKEEVRAAVSGLNQELKEIILKYDGLLKLNSIQILLGADHRDDIDAEVAFIIADDESDPEVISVLEKPIFGDDEADEEYEAFAEPPPSEREQVSPVAADQSEVLPTVPVQMLNTKAHITVAYRNSKSKALLFETHPIIQ